MSQPLFTASHAAAGESRSRWRMELFNPSVGGAPLERSDARILHRKEP